MRNDLTLRYYSFFVSFNPFTSPADWEWIADKAQKYYVDFLNTKDYGDNLMSTTFNFLIEKEIDFNKQDDYISTSSYLGIPKTARLTLHINYDYFFKCNDYEKFRLTINGILYLLKHWNANLKVPKGNPLENIANELSELLIKENLILSDSEIPKAYIKVINPFRFSFMKHHFEDLNEKQILFNTNQIEKYLNNNLTNIDFGKSINKVYFSYDIFNFNSKNAKDYIDEEKKYQYGREKDLCFMEQYDSQTFLNKTKYEQVVYLHQGLLKAILRIKEMKRKPKYFNVDKFYITIDKLMTDYEGTKCR